MARIGGINVRDNSHAEIALTDIFGIGRVTAQKLCDAAGVTRTTKIRDLTEAELEKLRDQVKAYDDTDEGESGGGRGIEGNLRRKIAMNIKNKKDIKTYAGRRHMANLPVNGQRTKTNARTRKGPKKPIRK